MIFNASLSQGQVPNQWKSVYVKPIYKCGSKTEASNYRPITLNSITCKVLESIVQNTIMTHLSNNNLIHPSQHGFRKNHTTVTNLLEFVDYLTNALNKNSICHVIYLDFVKAFDKVPHSLLLLKLQAYGITGSLLQWCESFLIGRRQSVSIGQSYSDWCDH